MLWLFPSKKDLEDKFVTMDDITSSLQVLYGQAFANNVNSMREAATGYFTTERLPKNVGDSVTLTLGEMLEKKLVLEMKDSNNNACSLTDSYVKLTNSIITICYCYSFIYFVTNHRTIILYVIISIEFDSTISVVFYDIFHKAFDSTYYISVSEI